MKFHVFGASNDGGGNFFCLYTYKNIAEILSNEQKKSVIYTQIQGALNEFLVVLNSYATVVKKSVLSRK